MGHNDQPARLGRRTLLPAAASALLAAAGARAASGASQPGADEPAAGAAGVEIALGQLDGLAREAMRRTGVPGMAVAVVHRDKIVYLKGFGLREAGRPEVVDADTVFALASLSKPFAATVVAGLVSDRLLDWDDPLVRHDPGFAMYDPWVTHAVTLRDMFAHRSGLPGHAGDRLEDVGYDRAAVLHRLRYQKPASSFRAQYAYTNFGLTAAAVAAAHAAGEAWEDVAERRLYRPLGMHRTSSRFATFIATANRARGHIRTGQRWEARGMRDPDAQSPAGGVTSSARDLAAWLRLLLARGQFDGTDIIAATALDETYRPQIVRTPPPANPTTDRAGFYGLGWNVDYDDQGRVRLSHSGAFNLGAATAVTLYPGLELGFVALTNAQPIGVPEAVGRSFFDLVFRGAVERDWVELFGQFFAKAMAPDYGGAVAEPRPPQETSPQRPDPAYTGHYANALYGPIEVAAGGGELLLRLGPRQDSFPLRHFNRDVFTYQPVGENAYGAAAVIFTLGASGVAGEVVIENLDLDGQGRFRRSGVPG
jgi:CubicO group peptidase (beta-lactamase class C family)